MSYFYNRSGKLSYSNSYRTPQQQSISFSSSHSSGVTRDPIRPTTLYVESENKLTNGHVAKWRGEAAMFKKNGDKINTFSAQNGHEFALSSVEENDKHGNTDVAGIILEHAAQPESLNFVHKGVHSTHQIKDNQHIHRLATSGSVVLAWVLADQHENSLDGLYNEYLNGSDNGICIIRSLGTDYFTIERVGSNNSINELRQDLDNLVQSFSELTGSA